MSGRCDVCEAPTDERLCSECDAKAQAICDAHLARIGIGPYADADYEKGDKR